jgi:hypothetical protein
MLVNRTPIHLETPERVCVCVRTRTHTHTHTHIYVYIYEVINPLGQEISEKTDGKIISLEKVKRSTLVWGSQNKV